MGLTATPAAARETTVVDVTITPVADVSNGFATVTVDLSLRSDVPLPSVVDPCTSDDVLAYATPVAGSRPWLAAAEQQPAVWISWRRFTRVSGTATEGVWRSATEVSPAWTGRWRLHVVYDPADPCSYSGVDLTGFGAVVDVGTAQRPPWRVVPALLAPMPVVSGEEVWTPRVRVTDRLTGQGVAAFMNHPCATCLFHQSARRYVNVGTPPPRADANGYWSSQPQKVRGDERDPAYVVEAFAKRGSRGYSLESQGGCATSPWVKWQATQRLTTAGRSIVVTGNAFPAPSIHQAANPSINVQVLTAGRWTTRSNAAVRDNGRYTLTWTAPSAGTYHVRAYKPGGVDGCQRSSGTVLSTVVISVR